MPDSKKANKIDAFAVSHGRAMIEACIHGSARFAIRLGNVETKALGDRLDPISIDRPIYVAGLARSGSTILLEALAAHPDVGTHRYRDFPLIFTPFWGHEIQRRSPAARQTATERAHGDGLLVTPDSPEAMEEPLWMAHFKAAHDPTVSQVLDETTDNPGFAQFYADHIRKLLLIRNKPRYAAKGNYNTTRLRYLLKLFPDARFVLPIRHPRTHIASLLKQHRLFSEGQAAHRRALGHLRRVGHFEFGLDRRPINVGDSETIAGIEQLWRDGNEVRGWARYWAHLYGWCRDQIEDSPALNEALLIVRFEDLCADPQQMLANLCKHCGLQEAEEITEFAAGIHAPTYYRPNFTAEEEAAITEETQPVAERYGYTAEDSPAADPPLVESR